MNLDINGIVKQCFCVVSGNVFMCKKTKTLAFNFSQRQLIPPFYSLFITGKSTTKTNTNVADNQ
jgi:hypothetical protein